MTRQQTVRPRYARSISAVWPRSGQRLAAVCPAAARPEMSARRCPVRGCPVGDVRPEMSGRLSVIRLSGPGRQAGWPRPAGDCRNIHQKGWRPLPAAAPHSPAGSVLHHTGLPRAFTSSPAARHDTCNRPSAQRNACAEEHPQHDVCEKTTRAMAPETRETAPPHHDACGPPPVAWHLQSSAMPPHTPRGCGLPPGSPGRASPPPATALPVPRRQPACPDCPADPRYTGVSPMPEATPHPLPLPFPAVAVLSRSQRLAACRARYLWGDPAHALQGTGTACLPAPCSPLWRRVVGAIFVQLNIQVKLFYRQLNIYKPSILIQLNI